MWRHDLLQTLSRVLRSKGPAPRLRNDAASEIRFFTEKCVIRRL